MCYGLDARPPLPPIAGGAGAHGRGLVLTASDGNRFRAQTVTADREGGPGILILPDVRGLHPFYEELAARFAEANVHATAMDYFGRTAGLGERDEGFDYMAHIGQMTPEGTRADVAAALDHLRSSDGGSAERIFSVGFCFGGRLSFNLAAGGHGLAGVIGFYGRVAEREPGDAAAPIRLAGSYDCPVLGLFGGADESITAADVEAFRAALDAAGVANVLVVYDRAPHSFFDRTFAQHRAACDDAWRRVLRFVDAGR